ncbi:diguanylate cyclase, partial [Aromatoleum toluclasticum]|uniref:diguanylate cyclase domain-containing protein n=1 Tax=Aromatoleum toluclasticum TaxID=92003 RepID=UPI001D189DD0
LFRSLRDTLRHVDLVARLSGDNFAVLLGKSAPGTEPDCRDIADRLLGSIARPFTIGDSAFELTASVGIAGYPADAGSADELLGCARSATHDAKA